MDATSSLGGVSTRTIKGVPTAPTASSAADNSSGNSSLMGVDKNDFLKLLVAQLRNQDPLKPMEDREFIAQMAQLNTVEQVAAMNMKLGGVLAFEAATQATSLIGKTIEANVSGSGTLRGTVEEVRFDQGTPVLIVGGRQLELSDVRRIVVSV